jgi:hypothetical protein
LALFWFLRPNLTSSRSKEKCGSCERSPSIICSGEGGREGKERGGREREEERVKQQREGKGKRERERGKGETLTRSASSP